MLLTRSLRNLRSLWRDLSAQSQRRLERRVHPDLRDGDVQRIREEMRESLAGRGGEVSSRSRAARLGHTYLTLSGIGRRRFLQLLATDFGTDRKGVMEAIRAFQMATGAAARDAEERLRSALIPPRVRLLSQFNDLPDGVKFVVDLRADLLNLPPSDETLKALDRDLLGVLTSWFDVGFLELQRITWDSPASLLEKLIEYEAVHEIESWTDLRGRLGTDRHCYAFFHPHMPGEPLIFVEVALMEQMATSIQALLDRSAPESGPHQARTAIFYSISNTQRGLRGISFGSFLIKRVVDDLCASFPKLKNFATLSPIPGYCEYLASRIAGGNAVFTPVEQSALAAAGADLSQGLPGLLRPGWHTREALATALRAPLLRTCAQYLMAVKPGGRPADRVARFHLGNGASIERLNWLGDTSVGGLRQSAGIMVNYGYRQAEIERNHEDFTTRGVIAASPELHRLAAG
jgi:malonyl-CoA decarboxylase